MVPEIWTRSRFEVFIKVNLNLNSNNDKIAFGHDRIEK